MHKLYERPGDKPEFLDVEAFAHDTECDHKDQVLGGQKNKTRPSPGQLLQKVVNILEFS